MATRSTPYDALVNQKSMSTLQETNMNRNGLHAQQAAIEASADMKRTQALERLEKLTIELQEFVQTKVNIHKEIKTKTTGVVNALGRFKKLDEEWRSSLHRTPCATSERNSQVVVEEAMDTGAEGDGESVAEEESETITTAETESFDQDGRILRKLKRKIRSPEGGAFHTPKKLKDVGPGHPIKKQEVVKDLPQNSCEQNKKPGWEKVQSRKDKKKERKKLLPEKPLVPPPKPNQKPRRTATRPEALIIRPANKDKYSEILTRIKADVRPDQVRNTVEKIRRTATGNILITLSKGSSDRGKDLQKTIAGILKEDANVISTGPEEDLEIRDIDEYYN
uniref:Uncharacterized protein n=1 Tax=Bracoviriform glomeratae TaxID=257816 RepID=Q6RY02_9VIRU|nr:hypothetical protein 8 [Bracoviriform glomeratae]